MKRGFSLLEAMVALAIAAMAFAAIFELQHELVDGQRRYEQAIARADLKRNALALIADVNPDEMAQGEIALPPNLTVRWTSTALTDPKIGAGFPRGDSEFTITLYRLTVDILGPDGTALQTFDVERMGWTLGSLS